MAISAVSNVLQTASPTGVSGVGNSGGFEDFKNVFKKALDDVNNSQVESEALTNGLATGQNDNIHQVMISAEKADIALQFTMQIRNKILDAYNEIMRMQI